MFLVELRNLLPAANSLQEGAADMAERIKEKGKGMANAAADKVGTRADYA